MVGKTVGETLAEGIAGLDPARLPASVRTVAEKLVLDIVGLCIAARRSDYSDAVVSSGLAPGRATAIGHVGAFEAAAAALINGTAAHGEDFDDTFEGGPVHAGAVVVPVALAVAEEFGVGGLCALKGIVVGVETMCRLSLVAPTRVHKAGFHPTSVFGAMAAAAAASATLGLDPPRIAHAFGIAGSMAGGIIEYLADGAWTKRLHAGWAAQSGIRAALLARAGFVGPLSVFEGTHGLFNGFARGSTGDYGQLIDGFGTRWLTETLAFKPFACGTMAQPYVDCAIRLARRGIAAEAIDEMVCEVAEGTVHRLWEPLASKQAPPNAYAAKFSTPFCIAAGFVLGDAGLASFSEATVQDPRLRALAAKVRYVVDAGNPYPRAYTGHIRARLMSGEVVEERQPHLRGGVQAPLSAGELERKFHANAAFGGWPGERAEAARALVGRLFDGTIDLTALRG
jgi:2-methylcitrate dehydratase PrpD